MYQAVVFIVLIVLVVMLQMYLCKRESRRAGLILPALFFLFSLLAVLGAHFYISPPNLISTVYQALQIFALMNIPTVILGAIYIMYHGRR